MIFWVYPSGLRGSPYQTPSFCIAVQRCSEPNQKIPSHGADGEYGSGGLNVDAVNVVTGQSFGGVLAAVSASTVCVNSVEAAMSVDIRYASGESVAAGVQLVIEKVKMSKAKNNLFIVFPFKPSTPPARKWFPK
jgi:hypothetical protein